MLRELEQEERVGRHRLPQISGVEEPIAIYPSENFFRLADTQWEVHPVDDPELGKWLVEGFAPAGLCLRDQIIVRMALETGARIREILTLTVGDWRARGSNQEARAWSKGSRGRRVKSIRFSSTTARMLRQYLNTGRAELDRELRRLEHLSDADPLFLSQRHKPYDYEAFKPHWYKLCKTLQLDLNVHMIRHWYVTMAMRLIAEGAKNSAEIVLRKEELVRYMAWHSPATLGTYEQYFKGVQHYTIQDRVHQSLKEDVADYGKGQDKRAFSANQRQQAAQQKETTNLPTGTGEESSRHSADGWAKLLSLGGTQ